MKRNKEFLIENPENINLSSNQNSQTSKEENTIDKYRKAIELQYKEIEMYQYYEITENNIDEIDKLILATEDLIANCMNDSVYSGNRDQNFVNLIFICHKISLKVETYKLEEKIKKLDETSKKVENRIKRAEDKNNNLVYNLLGFLTAFSIVSGVVGVVGQIKGLLNIMIFIVFTLLILLTTLIGLHNFYENNNKRQSILQDNYFLWRVAGIILVCLIIVAGIKYIGDNKENIFNYSDKKIEEIVDKKINEIIEKN